MKKTGIAIALTVATFGCHSNSNTPPTPTGPCGRTVCSDLISPETFVQDLITLAKSGKIAAGYADSKVLEDRAKQGDYFVIWDGARQQPVAVKQDWLTEVTFNAYGPTDIGGGAGSFATPNGKDSQAASGMNYTYYTNYWLNGYPPGTPFTGHNDVVLLAPLTGGGYVDSQGNLFNHLTETKDVSLQISDARKSEIVRESAVVSRAFQMNYESAAKIVLLGEQIKAISGNRAITAADRSEISRNVFAIAGITGDQLNQTIAEGLKGNDKAVDSTLEEVARNLGMPSAEKLRNRILPALGVNLN